MGGKRKIERHRETGGERAREGRGTHTETVRETERDKEKEKETYRHAQGSSQYLTVLTIKGRPPRS